MYIGTFFITAISLYISEKAVTFFELNFLLSLFLSAILIAFKIFIKIICTNNVPSSTLANLTLQNEPLPKLSIIWY